MQMSAQRWCWDFADPSSIDLFITNKTTNLIYFTIFIWCRFLLTDEDVNFQKNLQFSDWYLNLPNKTLFSNSTLIFTFCFDFMCFKNTLLPLYFIHFLVSKFFFLPANVELKKKQRIVGGLKSRMINFILFLPNQPFY